MRILLLLGTLLLVGCSSTPQIVYVAATPAPTVVITPDPEPTLDNRYSDYVTWKYTYGTTLGDLNTQAKTALVAQDYVLLAMVESKMLEKFKSAVVFLEDNPPAECYAKEHALHLKAMNHFVTGTNAIIKWLVSTPVGTDADMETFTTETENALADMNSANDTGNTCLP